MWLIVEITLKFSLWLSLQQRETYPSTYKNAFSLNMAMYHTTTVFDVLIHVLIQFNSVDSIQLGFNVHIQSMLL